MSHSTRYSRCRQKGVALFVALVFLVVLTILGTAALNSSTLQTRMASGGALNNYAFQSAEIGVSAGEAWLESLSSAPMPGCVDPCTDTSLVWSQALSPITPDQLANKGGWFTSNGRAFTAATVADPSSPSLTAPEKPRYVIEELGNGKDPTCSIVAGAPPCPTHYYLVAGRGASGQSAINTVTQTVYAKAFGR